MIARLLLLFAMVVAPLASAAAETLTVMTYNVRYPSPDDGADRWENRRDLLGDTIRKSAPDLIGTQELFQSQGDYITAKLPRYSWFGIDRRGGHDDEHMGIFYRSDRLKLIEQGNFWLSDTPEVVGSISWGHPLPRMVNWGLFETRSGRRFRLYNTHFPYRGEDEAARTKAARLIAERISADDGIPAILTGDFNTGDDSEAHRTLTETLSDSWTTAKRRSGPTPGYHGFNGGEPDRRIDWILSRGFDAISARSIDAALGGHYPSDHYPLVTKLRFAKP
tara:strand:+ start:65 stop:898 length:834 start_codon:yes stop_codon:yes gene_type:complete